MPTNKNAQLRYQILDRCLSNRYKRYNPDISLWEARRHRGQVTAYGSQRPTD